MHFLQNYTVHTWASPILFLPGLLREKNLRLCRLESSLGHHPFISTDVCFKLLVLDRLPVSETLARAHTLTDAGAPRAYTAIRFPSPLGRRGSFNFFDFLDGFPWRDTVV
jgi:hypothetical protein